jgi:hypothetical protein
VLASLRDGSKNVCCGVILAGTGGLKRLSFAYFSLPLQRKVGAAPHRGNARSTDTKSRMPTKRQKPKTQNGD